MTGLTLHMMWLSFSIEYGARIDFEPSKHVRVSLAPLLGGHSVCDPPDPIPNSAVKPDSADGTIA